MSSLEEEPKGFLQDIDSSTIGGNMQYISTGNINATKKTALILLDYPTKTRLKVWAPASHPEMQEKLVLPDYKAKVERLVIFHIKAFDWNCPQHITQKYTLDEMKALLTSDAEFRDYILGSGV